MHKSLIIAVMLIALAGCNFAEVRWEKARSENTIEAYKEYLRQYPKDVHSAQARAGWEKLAFADAQRRNTISAYENYLKDFPKGKNADIARAEMERLAFADAQRQGTIAAYENYLKGFPKGKNADAARGELEAMLFPIAQKQNTPSSYAEHLKRFPKGKFALKAKKGIVSTAKSAKLAMSQKVFGELDTRDQFNLQKAMTKLLDLCGIQAVPDNAEKFDVAFKIETKASAESKTFHYPGSSAGISRYAAASFDLKFTLEMPDGSRFEDDFHGYTEGRGTISPGDHKTIKTAPVWSAYPPMMADFIPFAANLFGPAPVLESFRFDSELAFRKLTDPNCAELLLAALKYPKHIHGAIVGLGKIKEPRGVEPLTALLTDPNPPIGEPFIDRKWDEKGRARARRNHIANFRKYVAEALGAIGDPRAVEPLKAVFKESAAGNEKLPDYDEISRMRLAIIRALGDIKDKKAVYAVADAALNEKQPMIRFDANFQLKRIAEREGHTLEKWWELNKEEYFRSR